MLNNFSSVRFVATLWTVARQAPLSMRFSRQEYWSGLPCLQPGNRPHSGIEPAALKSPALAAGFFTTSSTWEEFVLHLYINLETCSVAQSYLTLCNPMDCSPSGSSLHRILQARILEWVAMPSSRRSSWSRDQTCVSKCPLHCQAGSLPLTPSGKPTYAYTDT